MLWTIVPAGILLFIAITQIKAWEQIKYPSKMPDAQLILQVTARQWDWTMRYPADAERLRHQGHAGGEEQRRKQAESRHWSEMPEIDDILCPTNCTAGRRQRPHLPEDAGRAAQLLLANLRLKQDALPGKTIPMWFNATDFNTRSTKDRQVRADDKNKEWEITCAELCGGGHYRMRGLLYVHETKDDYLKWLKHVRNAQRSREPEKKAATVAAKD